MSSFNPKLCINSFRVFLKSSSIVNIFHWFVSFVNPTFSHVLKQKYCCGVKLIFILHVYIPTIFSIDLETTSHISGTFNNVRLRYKEWSIEEQGLSQRRPSGKLYPVSVQQVTTICHDPGSLPPQCFALPREVH